MELERDNENAKRVPIAGREQERERERIWRQNREQREREIGRGQNRDRDSKRDREKGSEQTIERENKSYWVTATGSLRGRGREAGPAVTNGPRGSFLPLYRRENLLCID